MEYVKFIKIEKRHSLALSIYLLTPIWSIVLLFIVGGIIFDSLGFNPSDALKFFSITPSSDLYGLRDLSVTATPLCLIVIGVSFCFKSNKWNIGAEGQLIFGWIVGGGVVLLFYNHDGFYVLPIIILSGAIGGMLFAMIPAILKTYFNTNEILVSLMLVYVAKLLLDYLVVCPLSNPEGFNLP